MSRYVDTWIEKVEMGALRKLGYEVVDLSATGDVGRCTVPTIVLETIEIYDTYYRTAADRENMSLCEFFEKVLGPNVECKD